MNAESLKANTAWNLRVLLSIKWIYELIVRLELIHKDKIKF